MIVQTPHFEMDHVTFHNLKIDKDILKLIIISFLYEKSLSTIYYIGIMILILHMILIKYTDFVNK